MPSLKPKKYSKAEQSDARQRLAGESVGTMAFQAYEQVWVGRDPLLWKDHCVSQVRNFLAELFILQEKQWEMAASARMCDHRCPSCSALYDAGEQIKKDCEECGPMYIGVGGARGGGKSSWMIAQAAIDDANRFPGISILYVRKSAKTLRAQIRKLLEKTFPESRRNEGHYNYREQVGEIKFKNGSMITIRHFKDESEIDNFLGEEYDEICYEELTTLSQDKFENLNSVLRTSKKGWRPRVYASWNWGGIGHAWVKKFFYDPWRDRRQITTRYILALVQDNRHNNPEYVNQLQNYVGWKYQSWYLGNPDLAAGNFFTHYREDVHVYPPACPDCRYDGTFVLKSGLCKCSKCRSEFTAITFSDNEAVRWFGSMDYGSSHPNCFHLHAEKANGDCFTVGESHTIDLGISENAEAFRDLCRLHNVEADELEFIGAGHDVNRTDRKTHEDGSTVATEYQENGILLTPIHIDRVNAFSQMQERLGDVDRGKRPTWYIHRSCTNLRTQIQTAQYDPKKPNDILKQNADKETGEGGDDALECVVGNTLVITARGEIEIADVRAGDMVMTSCGWRRVLEARMTSDNEDVFDIKLLNGTCLRATANHPIWTERGWVAVDSLRNDDIVSTWLNLKQSYSTESNSAAIPTQDDCISGIIIGQAETIANAELARSMWRSGAFIKERFQSVIKFIIKTVKALGTRTTASTTWIALPASNISGAIQWKAIRRSSQTSTAFDRLLLSGIIRKRRASLQSEIGQPRSVKVSNGERSNASFAANHTKREPQTTSVSFVRLDAKRRRSEKMDAILRKESASSAERRLRLTNADRPKLVRVPVVGVYAAGQSAVYNLTAEDCPEYFAGGVLVHNCARNGIVGAYNSVLTTAKPIKMGNYQGFSETPQLYAGFVDIEAEIAEAEKDGY